MKQTKPILAQKRAICTRISAQASDTRRTQETAVQGILERTTPDKHSRVVLTVVPNTRRPELCGNVREHVEKGSTVCTDALMSYDGS